MSTSAKVATGTIGPTVSNTVDLTVSGFGTATAAVIFLSRAATADNPSTNAGFSTGFWTASTQSAVAVQMDSGLSASTETARAITTGRAAQLLSAASGTSDDSSFYELTASSITDGIRLTVSSSSASLTYYVYAILFKGTTNVYVGSQSLGTGTSAIDITAPGFKPDLVLFHTNGDASAPRINNNAIYSIGVAHNNSSDTVSQGMAGFWSEDNQSDTDSGSYIRSGYVAGQVFNGTASWLASVGSFDASGFSITPSASANNDPVYFLALELADPDDAYVGIVDSKTSTGTQAYTGAGFTPEVLGLIQTACTAEATITTQGSIAFGTTDGTRTRVFSVRDANGAATTDCGSKSKDQPLYIRLNDGTVDAEASLSSFDADGWTLNYSDGSASARKMLAFAIGDSTAGGAAPTLSDLQAVNITASSVQGTYDYAF